MVVCFSFCENANEDRTVTYKTEDLSVLVEKFLSLAIKKALYNQKHLIAIPKEI